MSVAYEALSPPCPFADILYSQLIPSSPSLKRNRSYGVGTRPVRCQSRWECLGVGKSLVRARPNPVLHVVTRISCSECRLSVLIQLMSLPIASACVAHNAFTLPMHHISAPVSRRPSPVNGLNEVCSFSIDKGRSERFLKYTVHCTASFEKELRLDRS
jgi:hypothetical protein